MNRSLLHCRRLRRAPVHRQSACGGAGRGRTHRERDAGARRGDELFGNGIRRHRPRPRRRLPRSPLHPGARNRIRGPSDPRYRLGRPASSIVRQLRSRVAANRDRRCLRHLQTHHRQWRRRLVQGPADVARTRVRQRGDRACPRAVPGGHRFGIPVRQVSAGTSAIIVPRFRSLCAKAKPSRSRSLRASRRARFPAPGLSLLAARRTNAGNHVCARFFFEAHGIHEDPATGNGAAFLGAYLLEHRLFPEAELDLRIEQGHEVRRPSLVRLRARIDGRAREVDVGGQVFPVVRGELL